MTDFVTQYRELGYVLSDVPRNEPCETVNRPLWDFWQRFTGATSDPAIWTEAEIVQRLDLLFMGGVDADD